MLFRSKLDEAALKFNKIDPFHPFRFAVEEVEALQKMARENMAARGMPVKAYTLALRRYFANNPGAIGKVMEFSSPAMDKMANEIHDELGFDVRFLRMEVGGTCAECRKKKSVAQQTAVKPAVRRSKVS